MLTVHDLPAELLEWAEGALHAPLERSFDYRDRLYGNQDGVRVTVILRQAGPENAGMYRQWLTLRKADFVAAANHARPAGYRIVYLMIGQAPDGRLWWADLYDEASLPLDEAEPMGDGRWYRFTPDQTKAARVAGTDLIQPSFWADLNLEPAAEPTPERPPGPAPTVRLLEAKVGDRFKLEGVVEGHTKAGNVHVQSGSVSQALDGRWPVTILEGGDVLQD